MTVEATAKSLSLAELLGAFSYALDLTEGQTPGHSIRACWIGMHIGCLLYTSPSPRDLSTSRMPSSA